MQQCDWLKLKIYLVNQLFIGKKKTRKTRKTTPPHQAHIYSLEELRSNT